MDSQDTHKDFVWLQEKIGKKENGEKENKKERKDERNYSLSLCLVGEKIEKKENRREIIIFCLIE